MKACFKSLMLLLLALSCWVFAEPNTRFSFQIHTQAQVLYQSSNQVEHYLIALDKYKKTQQRWLPEKSLDKAGHLSRLTLELPRRYTEQQAFAFYVEQLPKTAELLFQCNARACGESNSWANEHFGIKQLYGVNASQYYGVFYLTGKHSPAAYVTIYTVRRGNGRLYTQIDTLTVQP